MLYLSARVKVTTTKGVKMSFNWSSQEVEFHEELEREVERQREQHSRKFGFPHPSFGEGEEE